VETNILKRRVSSDERQASNRIQFAKKSNFKIPETNQLVSK